MYCFSDSVIMLMLIVIVMKVLVVVVMEDNLLPAEVQVIKMYRY